MGDVAVLGVGMHPWGKFPEKNLNSICRVAVDAALADAGVKWKEVGAKDSWTLERWIKSEQLKHEHVRLIKIIQEG